MNPDNVALVVSDKHELAVKREGSIRELVARADLIREAMSEAMVDGIHFGRIPGVAKPSLFQAGAEKIDTLFRLKPAFTHTEKWDGQHLTVVTEAAIYHLPTGECLAEGVSAICSTYESKYRWRKAELTCPTCGAETIRKSKNVQPGKGWYCWTKLGGCGAQFDIADSQITEQKPGRKENEDLADQWETIIRMSEKRAHVAVTRMATAASDVFTQDVEDMPDFQKEPRSSAVEEQHGSETPQSPPLTNGPSQSDDVATLRNRAMNHARYVKAEHFRKVTKGTVEELRALLAEWDASDLAGETQEIPETDSLDSTRQTIRSHERFKEEGGEDAYGELLKTGDEEALTGLLAYLNGAPK